MDARNEKKRRKSKPWGYGLLFNYDQTGDSKFSTIQVGIPLALHLPFSKNKFIISLGIMPMVASNSLNLDGLRFADQFWGGSYQGSSETQDVVPTTSMVYPNLAAGCNFKLNFSKKANTGLGFSAFNLITPGQDFTGDNASEIRERFCIHSITVYRAAAMMDVVPNGKFQFQGKQQEFQFGCLAIHYFDNISIPQINYGIWFRSRSKDAVILNIGFNLNGFNVGFSYDINISKLRVATNTVGAFEISVVYIYNKLNYIQKRKSIKCPSFI